MERLMTPLKRGTKDYLMRIIVPSLIEGLTQLSISRPQDPHLFIAKFLLNKSPAAEKYEVTRKSTPAAGSALAAVRSKGSAEAVEPTTSDAVTRAVDAAAAATATAASAANIVGSGPDSARSRSPAILSDRTDASLLQYLSDVEEGGATHSFGERPSSQPPDGAARHISPGAQALASPELAHGSVDGVDDEAGSKAGVAAAGDGGSAGKAAITADGYANPATTDTGSGQAPDGTVLCSLRRGLRVGPNGPRLVTRLVVRQFSFFLHAYDPKTFKSYQLNANGIDCTGLAHDKVRQVAENILSRLDFLDSGNACPVLSITADGGPLVPLDWYG